MRERTVFEEELESMKKWSIISSLVVFAALAVASFATVGAASAGNYHPYCPSGEVGTPPYCHHHGGGGGHKTCSSGQVGKYPHCVTPALKILKDETAGTKLTVIGLVNAPGKIKASGEGLETAGPSSVKAGPFKLELELNESAKKELKSVGIFKTTVTVLYQPTGASPITKTILVTFVVQHHHHHHHGHHHHDHHHHH